MCIDFCMSSDSFKKNNMKKGKKKQEIERKISWSDL